MNTDKSSNENEHANATENEQHETTPLAAKTEKDGLSEEDKKLLDGIEPPLPVFNG